MVTIDQIKKLREKTGAGIMECKKALEEVNGDEKKAKKLIFKWGIERSQKKAERETKEGIIDAYIHSDRKIGVIIELFCETDFVARTDDFKNLAHELSLQIASMDPKDVATLLSQEYIREGGITVEELIKKTIGKLGENIKIGRFARFSL